MSTTIELAKQSGASVYRNRNYPDRPFQTFSPEQLEAFRALCVAERDKELMANVELPEPVAHCQLSIGRKTVAYFDGKPIFMTGPVGNDSHRDPLYTATQLAAARLQGAEEERSLRAQIMELHAKASLEQSQRIAELEQQLAEKREVLTLERNADKTLEEIVGEIRALKGMK